jgi:murein DD-endopeptidase MepM/ murein hydrolase activator NlpD
MATSKSAEPSEAAVRLTMNRARLTAAAVIATALFAGCAGAQEEITLGNKPTARRFLVPQYPANRNCSPLTSLYESWDDVDGSKRAEAHSGVDGGRLGDPILAPAAGEVIAVWRANWGWGQEGALMMRHSKAELGLADGADHYYSEFDHLRFAEIRTIAVGTRLARGQRFAHVFRPGGSPDYLPEVHWEVWAVPDDAQTTWGKNKFGGRFWTNQTADLVDPLLMLSLNAPDREDGGVDIPVFEPGRDYRKFRGFTYILPCPRRTGSRPLPRVPTPQ